MNILAGYEPKKVFCEAPVQCDVCTPLSFKSIPRYDAKVSWKRKHRWLTLWLTGWGVKRNCFEKHQCSAGQRPELAWSALFYHTHLAEIQPDIKCQTKVVQIFRTDQSDSLSDEAACLNFNGDQGISSSLQNSTKVTDLPQLGDFGEHFIRLSHFSWNKRMILRWVGVS